MYNVKITINLLLTLFLLISCKQKVENKIISFEKVISNDTLYFENQNLAIFINPTITYIDGLKKTYNNEDDFYIIADDANFYNAEAQYFLKEKKIKIENISNNQFLKIGDTIIKISQYKPWTILLYNKNGSFNNFAPIDIKESYLQFFLPEAKVNDLEKYQNQENYFITIFDMNQDAIPDKIISSKPYKGDELLVFYGKQDGTFNLVLETINFSEDGGNIIKNIVPINNSKGFNIITNFPDGGYYEEEHYVVPQNHTWLLQKIIYKTRSDNSENAILYSCDVSQNIDLTKENWMDKIIAIPDEQIRKEKCNPEKL